jgi:NAD+ kinase
MIVCAAMRDVLVVYKKSSYELYAASPDEAVQAYMRRGGADVDFMRLSHEAQSRTLDLVLDELARAGARCETIFRGELGPIVGRDLVVAVGGDGTFLEVSHYVADTPLLGVNSDPAGSTGYFCTARSAEVRSLLADLAAAPRTVLGRLLVERDGVPLPQLVLNDVLLAHANPAATVRYRIEAGGRTATYKSSGLLVCTAAGSTAWMYQEGGQVMPLASRALQYLSRGVRAERPAVVDELRVHSLTRQGLLYVDGPHLTHECGLGCELRLRAGAPLTVVGDLAAKRRAYGG